MPPRRGNELRSTRGGRLIRQPSRFRDDMTVDQGERNVEREVFPEEHQQSVTPIPLAAAPTIPPELLAEMAQLRAEVRGMAQMRAELQALKAQVGLSQAVPGLAAMAVDPMPTTSGIGSDTAKLIAKISKMDPPKFYGGEDPAEIDQWISGMEKIFRIVQCTDNEKVRIATFQLKEEAELWWQTECPTDEMAATYTWSRFLTKFQDRFYTDSLRDQMYDQFQKLEQRDRSFHDLLKEFTKLSRFAGDHVMTDKDRIKALMKAMHPDLRVNMGNANLETESFASFVDRAYAMELSMRVQKSCHEQEGTEIPGQTSSSGGSQKRYRSFETQSEEGCSTRKRSTPTLRGGGRFGSSPQFTKDSGRGSGPMVCQRCGGSHQTSTCTRGRCFCCGSTEHQKSICPKKDLKCSRCGRTGHLSRMCTASSGTSPSMSQASTPSQSGRGRPPPRSPRSQAIGQQEQARDRLSGIFLVAQPRLYVMGKSTEEGAPVATDLQQP